MQAFALGQRGGQNAGCGGVSARAHTLAPLVVSCAWLWANYLTTGRAAFVILIRGLSQMCILKTLLALGCFSFNPDMDPVRWVHSSLPVTDEETETQSSGLLPSVPQQGFEPRALSPCSSPHRYTASQLHSL